MYMRNGVYLKFPTKSDPKCLIKTYNIIIHFPKWAEVTVLNAEYYFSPFSQ